ncbi:MAG: HAMP domain-containing histidine kinase [Lachnospiraceae bacterium]|nr:HAMP domain-containing histidine kinase [Lachnospiraceae bacterium]
MAKSTKRSKARIRNHRMGMTLLLSGIVFITLVVTMVAADAIAVFLAKHGILNLRDTSEWSVFRIGVDIAIISVIVGTLLVFTLGRLPLISVNKVINAMNRVADGDFSTRLQFRSVFGRLPAVNEVTDSFNRMTEELEKTETLREDFVNNFSHEFKTPIVSIAGFAKLLKNDRELNEEQRSEYLSIIEEESLRLSAMATNVLSLTRIENQTILTGVSTYNLSEQLRRSLLLLEDRWEKKRLDVRPEFDEITIEASEELLEQVWINLLDNAVKFAPEGGILAIEAREEADRIVVKVKNSGSRLPEEERELLFHKFYQADHSHASAGNGVGLAVVKKAVQLHKGTVKAEQEGDFAVFTVTLPKKH